MNIMGKKQTGGREMKVDIILAVIHIISVACVSCCAFWCGREQGKNQIMKLAAECIKKHSFTDSAWFKFVHDLNTKF